jgi:hypothetical protein
METYDTLVEGIQALRDQGYIEDFNLKENCLECRNGQFRIFHYEFIIDKQFHFDFDEDTAGYSVLYVITSDKYKLKGLLVNGYGIYSEDITNEMLDKLKNK